MTAKLKERKKGFVKLPHFIRNDGKPKKRKGFSGGEAAAKRPLSLTGGASC